MSNHKNLNNILQILDYTERLYSSTYKLYQILTSKYPEIDIQPILDIQKIIDGKIKTDIIEKIKESYHE